MGIKEHGDIPIAITGLACRLPGEGSNLQRFWDSICNGTSAWSEIPKDRFNRDAFPESIPRGAHFLREDISLFDAAFFRIHHAEARAMDPQQRLMLEVVYEALEAGGYPLESLSGTATGVYMGQFTSDYKELVCKDAESALPFSVTGLQLASLANRISWLLDLKGPSFTMDTACSSSLVALHLACQSLKIGESQMAIVGGGNLMISPDMFIFEKAQGFLSPDGRCKTFDESANGYGRGEGFAVVVLKRLDNALADGDAIRAVIRGTATNQDGRTKGFTLPSSDAQASLIRSVYRSAGLDFNETGYVETHGTGTKAGDLEETTALSRTLARARPDGRKLIIGSVKSNIGHLEAAAGLAGVMKSVMMLETGKIPPSIHLHNPNPSIPFDEWNIDIPTSATEWPSEGLRRISVNSFGYGGSNAHVILDDARNYLEHNRLRGTHNTEIPTEQVIGSDDESAIRSYRIFTISAQDKDGIGRVKRTLAAFLESKATTLETLQKSTEYLDNLAYTLSDRRSHLQCKTFCVASSIEELITILSFQDSVPPTLPSSRKPLLAFVFTGQGAQWAAMGMDLMSYPTFRESIHAADRHLKTLGCEWSAEEELSRGKSTSKLRNALYSQALCTVLQVALVDLVQKWGIFPKAVIGHSSGEIGAAYCLGALSREDAWKIAYFRGVMSSRLRSSGFEGAMMATGISSEDAAKIIAEIAPNKIHIACINSPKSVTLSGDADTVDLVLRVLQERGIFARKLQVDTAYHSPHMQTVAREYFDSIVGITTTTPRSDCHMYSSVTGEAVDADELGAVYWVRNLMSPVRFAPAIQQLAKQEEGLDLLVEIGPHSALQGPSTQSLQAVGVVDVPYYSVLTRFRNGIETALNLAGTLFTHGYPVRFREVNQTRKTALLLVNLPSYPWNHSQSHWAESRVAREYRLRSSPYNTLLGAKVPSVVSGENVWRRRIRLADQPWIADHKIHGSIFYPAAGFLASAIEAALSIAETGREVSKFRLRDVHLKTALAIEESDDVEYTVSLRPYSAATQEISVSEFTITSYRERKTPEKHCYGLIMLEYQTKEGNETEDTTLPRLEDTLVSYDTLLKTKPFYQSLTGIGFQYGPVFQNVKHVWCRNGQSLGDVSITDIGLDTTQRPHIIHPATLDAVFHLVFAALNKTPQGLRQAMVPKMFDEIEVNARIPYEAGSCLQGFADATRRGFQEIISEIVMRDSVKGDTVLRISGFCLQEIGGGSGGVAETDKARSICSSLVWRPAIDLLHPEEQADIFSQANGPSRGSSEIENSDICMASSVTEVIKLLHHSNPSLTICEIVGSGNASRPILSNVQSLADVHKTANCRIWCLDEASKHDVEELLQGSEDVQVDIQNLTEPEAQEKSQALSDLIVLPFNLYPVENMIQIIRNVKTLLVDDGRLCLIAPRSQETQVETLGKEAGLKNWIKVGDAQKQQTLLIGSNKFGASSSNEANKFEKVVILLPTVLSEQAALLSEQLRDILAILGYAVSFQVWADTPSWESKSCISLLEIDQSIFHDISEEDFNLAKSLILEANRTLWVSGHGEPFSSIMNGIARVIRNEEPGLAFRTLEFDKSKEYSSNKLADLIIRSFHNHSADNEYKIMNGVIHISRILEDDDMNSKLHLLNPQSHKTVSKIAIGEAAKPLRLSIRNAGLLNTLCFELDSTVEAGLANDEVEIMVKATPVSVRDAMTAMGQLWSTDLGFAAAGVIRQVGSAVSQFKVGDRVVTCSLGGHRTVLREAALIPLSHGTAWYGLMRLARVQKGESILIHDATRSIGRAAIEIAQHAKLDIFATVTSDAERALLQTNYRIPKGRIFSSKTTAFVDDIKRMTDGRGVDVILNSTSGETLRQTWNCIAPFGTFVEVGSKNVFGTSRRDMKPLVQDTTFTSFDLHRLAQQRPELMKDILTGALDLVRKGITNPITSTALFPASNVESAFRFVESQSSQEAVITFSDNDVVPYLHLHELSLNLNPNATYLLPGGLGGLGRGIAKMLVDNGARKLCFLSRSGAASSSAQTLIRELESRDVQILVQPCDIADLDAVQNAITRCSNELGPIRGVIQLAMVLRDTLFRNMTHKQWIESTRPKIQGTRNLHHALPEVDFFITLGSFTAIFGNRGQSNYAAGGAYQDALAHARREKGQHAVTIDVGVVRDAGVLAENGMSNTLRDFEGPYGLDETELLNLVKLAIAGDIAGTISPQILTGLATGGSVIATSVEAWYLSDPKFSIMAQTGAKSSQKPSSQDKASVQRLLSSAASLAEAAQIVTSALATRIAAMLQVDSSEIDTNRFLYSYGVDSLTAIQVVDWALRECGARITVLDVMAGVPISETGSKIALKSGHLAKELK